MIASLAAAIHELEREKKMRERVYPNLLQQQKLSAQEIEKRGAALECAIENLRDLAQSRGILIDEPRNPRLQRNFAFAGSTETPD